ncbi:hypothetical protein QP735_02905 [Curtobacterium citreum]|uniref:putative T7SS-secreted protein n=1 Tax=Curtobacterium citreum TaxID=2036 RepID=UPI00254A9A73|nr:hypothetical protein [Curtobacterium citreum]MDK8171466.1 hypothetical protein [Curtobacterium citreum]
MENVASRTTWGGMMARPSGWDVVDQGDDPVKGDPATIRMMGREYQRISDAASDASTRLNSVKGSGWLTDWEGEAADVFVDAIQDTPSDLSKLVDSYALAASALSGWADVVDDTQYRADGALADAKDAAGDLTAAQDRLSDAQSTLSHYQTAARSLSQVADQYPAGTDVPAGVEVPTPAQVRAASDNTAVAQGSVSSAQGDIAAAQSRIDAAKRLVADARGDWEDGERRTATKIGEAADAGLGKQSFWDEVFGSEWWETIVSVAKVVVAVGGIIVMIIGGPLAWIVLGAGLLVLADTLYKMSKGTADGWDLAFALLDCIPGTKGITTLAGIGGAVMAMRKGGQGLKVAMASLRAGRNTVTGAIHGLSGGAYKPELAKFTVEQRSAYEKTLAHEQRFSDSFLGKLFAGNRFNVERSHAFTANEVHVRQAGKESYVRVDSYDPLERVVSRKSTQLARISESTGLAYVHEFVHKYKSGEAVIAETPHNLSQLGEFGVNQPLRGQMILEVPVQNLQVPEIVASTASAHNIAIMDPLGNLYNEIPGLAQPISFMASDLPLRATMVTAGASTAVHDLMTEGGR